MEFFKELFLMSENLDFTMKVKRVGHELTISILPDKVDGVHPIIITATVEELDKEFFNKIKGPMDKARVTIVNLDNYEKEMDALVEEKRKELENKKKSNIPSTTKPVTATKKKAVVKNSSGKNTAKSKKLDDDDDENEEVADDVDTVAKDKAKAAKKATPKKAENNEVTPKEGEKQVGLFS
jgi:PRTRC genetic system protein E